MTPATLARLLTGVNAKLRAQAAARPHQVPEEGRALTHVDREIANYGKLREAIQQSLAPIPVGGDGSLRIAVQIDRPCWSDGGSDRPVHRKFTHGSRPSGGACQHDGLPR